MIRKWPLLCFAACHSNLCAHICTSCNHVLKRCTSDLRASAWDVQPPLGMVSYPQKTCSHSLAYWYDHASLCMVDVVRAHNDKRIHPGRNRLGFNTCKWLQASSPQRTWATSALNKTLAISGKTQERPARAGYLCAIELVTRLREATYPSWWVHL